MNIKIEGAKFWNDASLKPAFPQNKTAITMAVSEEYAKFLFVLLASIRENACSSNYYDVIVLSDGLSLSNRVAMIEENTRDNFSLRFVDAISWLDNKKFYTFQHIGRTTYLRLAVFDILSCFEKVIYLDCDMVVNRDIGELYNQCIEGYMVAAVKDTVMRGWCCAKTKESEEQCKYNEEQLGMLDVSRYFNAGVMILNIKEFCSHGYTSSKLINMALSKKWRWLDQDLLNKVCYDNVVFLDARWNVMVHPFEFESDMSEFNMPEPEFKLYLKTIENPYIVHYAGHALPVFEPIVERCDLFWKYARKTSRYGQLQNDMYWEIARKITNRSLIRKIADFLLPYGTKRRVFFRGIIKSQNV